MSDQQHLGAGITSFSDQWKEAKKVDLTERSLGLSPSLWIVLIGAITKEIMGGLSALGSGYFHLFCLHKKLKLALCSQRPSRSKSVAFTALLMGSHKLYLQKQIKGPCQESFYFKF